MLSTNQKLKLKQDSDLLSNILDGIQEIRDDLNKDDENDLGEWFGQIEDFGASLEEAIKTLIRKVN